MLEQALAIINASEDKFRALSDFIHANPEEAMVETQAAKRLAHDLAELGFEVTAPYSGIFTAFKAEKSFGSGGKHICFLCEYDALPVLGHACGHNLIAAVAVAGAWAAAEMLREADFGGTISVIGTPAEEGKGGKVIMLRNGAFDGVDNVLLSHPFSYTAIDPGALAVTRYTITFTGRQSHAAAAPHEGINALDAVNLMFAGIGAWRQQLPPGGMVHGIISDGGDAPNIIPGSATAEFYIRSEEKNTQLIMEKRLENIAAGAALMTGCELDIKRCDNPYEPTLLNHDLSETVFELTHQLGMEPQRDMKERISTDFGNVSQHIPGVNFFFGITDKANTPLHSVEFCNAAASDYAFDQAMKAAAVLAETALRLLKNEI